VRRGDSKRDYSCLLTLSDGRTGARAELTF
jgi:hypothetical protein